MPAGLLCTKGSHEGSRWQARGLVSRAHDLVYPEVEGNVQGFASGKAVERPSSVSWLHVRRSSLAAMGASVDAVELFQSALSCVVDNEAETLSCVTRLHNLQHCPSRWKPCKPWLWLGVDLYACAQGPLAAPPCQDLHLRLCIDVLWRMLTRASASS